jgi:hypothetical protein
MPQMPPSGLKRGGTPSQCKPLTLPHVLGVGFVPEGQLNLARYFSAWKPIPLSRSRPVGTPEGLAGPSGAECWERFAAAGVP